MTIKEYKKTLRQCVNRGVKALDAFYGKSKWPKRIKLKTFDIRSSRSCIVGQVMNGDPYDFYQANGSDGDIYYYDPDFGFSNTADFVSVPWNFDGYSYLQKLWLTTIRQRKGLKHG